MAITTTTVKFSKDATFTMTTGGAGETQLNGVEIYSETEPVGVEQNPDVEFDNGSGSNLFYDKWGVAGGDISGGQANFTANNQAIFLNNQKALLLKDTDYDLDFTFASITTGVIHVC